MKTSEHIIPKSLRIGAGACLLLSLLANNKAMAQSLYFVGPAGGIANNGSYSWDDATSWGATSGTAGGAGGPWVQGDFARFYGGAGDSYTVTANADEQNVGLYNDNATANLTINAAGSGDLNVLTTIQGFLSTSGSSTTINAPITGVGGVAPELSGSVSLFGVNTYSGGTALGDSGNTLTYFNNSSSFGGGGISLNRTGNFSTLLSVGGSPITIANPFSTVLANTGPTTDLNFANGVSTPVTSSGSWTLGTVGLGLRNNGNSTAPLTLTGGISGTANMTFSGANGGTINLSPSTANSFSGTLTVGGGAGENAITVSLGTVSAMSSVTGVTLAGGTLNTAAVYQSLQSAPLTLSASSTITGLANGNNEIDFADSHLAAWTGVLNLADWTQGAGPYPTSLLEFANNSGLTSAQLADIEFDGNPATLGTAQLITIPDSGDGYVTEVAAVPEPPTAILGMIGGLTFLWRARRRSA